MLYFVGRFSAYAAKLRYPLICQRRKRIAPEYAPQSEGDTDGDTALPDRLLRILRTGRGMAAESVGMQVFERAVIGGECLLVRINEPHSQIARKMENVACHERQRMAEEIAHGGFVRRLYESIYLLLL